MVTEEELKTVPPSRLRPSRKRWLILPLCGTAAVVVILVLAVLAWPAQAPATTGVVARPIQATTDVILAAGPSPEPADVLTHSDPQPLYDFTLPAPESEPVDADYFQTAVFLGDSRTDGLRLYSGIVGPDFFTHNGLMVFEAENRERRVIKGDDGKKHSVLEMLALKQYDKVYTMFGINELSYGDDQAFYDTYGKFIDEIRACQPNAIIYIEAIVPINPEVTAAHNNKYPLSNERIAVYNELLKELAAEKRVIYLDLATALSDENGVLPADATSDGVHFRKDWYKKWYEYLKNHTVSWESYAAGQTAEDV